MSSETARKFFSSDGFYWIPACVVAYLWIFLAGTLSDALARWNIDVFVPGILVVVPALLMPRWRGFAVVLISGFLYDASLPIPFETMERAFGGAESISLFGEMTIDVPATVGFGAMQAAIFFFALRFLRSRVDLTSLKQWLACAVAVNFVIFLLWAIPLSWRELGAPEFWLGFFIDALISSAFIALAGRWFFDALISLYRICGADLVGEREAIE